MYALIINTKTKIENIYEIQIGKLYKSNSPLNECIYMPAFHTKISANKNWMNNFKPGRMFIKSSIIPRKNIVIIENNKREYGSLVPIGKGTSIKKYISVIRIPLTTAIPPNQGICLL